MKLFAIALLLVAGFICETPCNAANAVEANGIETSAPRGGRAARLARARARARARAIARANARARARARFFFFTPVPHRFP